MEEFLIGDKVIFYHKSLDGGGTTFGINALKHPEIVPYINKGKILEICSGPGFMGFYLNFMGFCDQLTLSDINEENNSYINETIKKNNLENTNFLVSDGLNSFGTGEIYNTIVSNPPHFKTSRPGGYRSEHEKLISLDENMEFHKKFFKDVVEYINQDSKIILVENAAGVNAQDIIELTKDTFNILLVHYDKYGWEGESSFYTIILKLK
jgi:methylase of polypeptide subunit release factors